ncbi:MAG: D-glycero-beta-D-manno-heptose-7-phosphate kinase [Rhodospirillales bacterium]|nr:D-glycero-beta-D-manno-heptose-7-phosphate kinase [Rhodospirillales bacterium]
MPECHVLVIGDIMLDRFVYGNVERISPESPVPVLSIKQETMTLGGAGNALSNLASLGIKPHIIAAIGNDDTGRKIASLVSEKRADADMLVMCDDRPTSIKTRFIAAHQQLLRTDAEDIRSIQPATEAAILAKAAEIIPAVHAIIMSDYGKGLLTDTIIKQVMALANERGIPVLVDPKGTDYSRYRGAAVVTPNRKELSEATNKAPTKTDEEITEAGRTLLQTSGIKAVLATRSEDGMTLLSADTPDKPVHLSTEALEVFDVSGAGDTVIATVAASLAAGATLEEATILANKAGGIVVAKTGTAAIRAEELLKRLDEDAAENKADANRRALILDREHALEQVIRWKAQGLKVGFTNGCFDILHYGHVTYLNDARDKCDRLIMGLNTDDSIKRLKGPDRPVNDQDARANVIGALGSIDLVVLFGDQPEEDDKASRLIEFLQPDIYFKGGDYTVDQIPEAPIVQAYGGEVMVMPVYEGHSTTGTIEKMKQNG